MKTYLFLVAAILGITYLMQSDGSQEKSQHLAKATSRIQAAGEAQQTASNQSIIAANKAPLTQTTN